MLVCVAGAEQIENMTPRDDSVVPCETKNQWRRKNDTGRWFHTCLFEEWAQYGLGRLHAVEQRGREKRGDILEWVMGTRKRAGADSAWLAWGEVVDGLSVFVYEFWSSDLCSDVHDKRTMCNKIFEACCLTDDWLETQVAARVESFRCIDLALRSKVGKRLVDVIHEFTIAPHGTAQSLCGASDSRSLATVHNTDIVA